MPRVLIVGGGPAGSACAITTARAGLETLLFESGSKYRDKPCGDALMPDAQTILEHLGVIDKVRRNSLVVPEMTVHFSESKQVSLEVPTLNLRRTFFDQVLRDEVEIFGGEVKYDSQIVGASIFPEKVMVRGKDGALTYGDVLVLATGSNVELARQQNFFFDKKDVAGAIRGYLKNDSGLNSNMLFFREDMSGYGWILPCPGNLLNVGIGLHQSSEPLKNAFDDLVKNKATKYSSSPSLIEKPRGSPLRIGLTPNRMSADRLILTGENVNCVYDAVGDGLGSALETGVLAGQVIINSGPHYSSSQLEIYEEVVRKRIGKINSDLTLLRKMIKHKPIHSAFTSILTNSQSARDTFSRYLRRESKRKIYSSKI